MVFNPTMYFWTNTSIHTMRYYSFYIQKQNLDIKLNWNKAFPFILVAASAVFPMMISLKQSGFYILPSFPFFALGIGILIYPIVNFLILRIKTHSFSFKVFTSISLLAFVWVFHCPSLMYMPWAEMQHCCMIFIVLEIIWMMAARLEFLKIFGLIGVCMDILFAIKTSVWIHPLISRLNIFSLI